MLKGSSHFLNQELLSNPYSKVQRPQAPQPTMPASRFIMIQRQGLALLKITPQIRSLRPTQVGLISHLQKY